MVILSDKVPVSTRILKKWMAPAWSVQYSSSTEALPPNDCIQNCPPPVMSWFTLLSILFPQAFLLDINFSTLLFTSLFSFVVVGFFCNWTALFISPSTSVFLIVLFHSVSVSPLAAAASPSFSSISILPSLISPRVQPLMPAATPRKKHIFCHIAMSVKFRSRVFVYVCVLGYVYARVSASRVLSSSNSISFADKHFCRQADRQGGMRERMSVCVSVCLFVRVCVCLLATQGRH